MSTSKRTNKGKIWLKKETRPYRASIILLTCFTVLATLVSLAFAYLVSFVINSADAGKEKQLWIFSAALLGLVLLKKCERLFVCGGYLSAGMLGEIIHAFKLGKEIRVFNRGVYGVLKEIAERDGYNLDLLKYDISHRYLSLSAKEIIPHGEDGEGDEDAL